VRTDEAADDGGLVTPSGLASTATAATSTAGVETPDMIELRKDRRYAQHAWLCVEKAQAPAQAHVGVGARRGEETPDAGPKALYSILPTKEVGHVHACMCARRRRPR
jgi:hypothetical protein